MYRRNLWKRLGVFGRRATVLLTVYLMLGSTLAAGAGLQRVLIAPESSEKAPLISGRSSRITLLFTNAGDSSGIIPPTVGLELVSQGKEPVRVSARIQDGQGASVDPGGFFKAVYLFELPENVTGLIHVRTDDANTVMVYAERGQTPAVADIEPRPINDMMPMFQPFSVNFSSYKPVFFLFGVHPGMEDTTFQLSFKYKLFNSKEEQDGNSWFHPLDKVYLAYTQQSFWDLESDSAPFEDSRYMPEIFYYEDDLGLKLPFLIGSGFQVGYQHESNGRGGEASRSTNYAYIQPVLSFKLAQNTYMKFAPKAWVYVNTDKHTNADIADYRGYYDLETSIGNPEGLALGNHFRHGKKGSTWQADLSYPLNKIPGFKWVMEMYLHAQYFTGYSDQFLEYNRREDVFRLGVSLVR